MTSGPHGKIAVTSPRDRWVARLWDRLWESYRDRVSYVQVYESLMERYGVAFTNDHIAFRTIAWQRPASGIFVLARILDAIGYRAAGCYRFEDKHLTAIHFQYPHPDFPKIFVSQFDAWELDDDARRIVAESLTQHRPLPSEEQLAALSRLDSLSPAEQTAQLDQVVDWIETRPWPAPDRRALEQLHDVSQYAAWVLVHGYRVNHYTALINSQHHEAVSDIERTVELLRADGVPMKEAIEGEPGSRLRQSATKAVVTDVEVRDGDATVTIPWTYAYLELAERGEVLDPHTGERRRFEGFLGPQATQLFEMTRK